MLMVDRRALGVVVSRFTVHGSRSMAEGVELGDQGSGFRVAFADPCNPPPSPIPSYALNPIPLPGSGGARIRGVAANDVAPAVHFLPAFLYSLCR